MGKKCLFEAFAKFIRRRWWGKCCDVYSAGHSRHLNDDLRRLVPVADLIRTEKGSAALKFCEFLQYLDFDPNVPCSGNEKALTVARESGNQVAAVEFLRMGGSPKRFYIGTRHETILNAVTEWTLEINGDLFLPF